MERYCTFEVGARRIGLPLALVRETLPPCPTLPLVLGPPWVLGLFSVRGQVVPVVDISRFVGSAQEGENEPRHAATHFVLVEQGDFRFAVPTHRVGTAEADPANLPPHPQSAIHPALEAEAEDALGTFHIVQLDRLQSTLGQALGFTQLTTA